MFIIAVFCLMGFSCQTKPVHVDQNKIYADIIGFSDDITTRYQFFRLNGDESDYAESLVAMTETIHTLERGSNTALFYTMDLALDRIQEVYHNADRNPLNNLAGDPETRYYIVLLTDGLDNVSTQLARNNWRRNYKTTEEYAAALQKRMSTILGKSNKTNIFQSFALIYKGRDLQEGGFTDEELYARMSALTGSQNAAKPDPVISGDIQSLVGQLLGQFQQTFAFQSLSFAIPKGYAEKNSRISMQLVDANGNAAAFEADFVQRKADWFMAHGNRQANYALENITASEGLWFEELEEGIIIEDTSVEVNAPSVRFSVNKLSFNNAPYIVSDSLQYIYGEGAWRMNSENTVSMGKDRNVYILLVLDRSQSLTDEDLQKTEEAMASLIRVIVEQL
jgi:hypothetical protein